MTRHPWVAAADDGVRFGVQLVLGSNGLRELPGVGRAVDALGFDALFVFDHPLLQADPWACMAALSTVTDRVRLGSAVTCAAYRHPAMVARLASDVDHLSGGRLLLGLGIGWLVPEFEAFGLSFEPPPARYAALEDTVQIVNWAWGEEPFSYEGAHFRTSNLSITPPVQQPRPPLIIGGSGEERTLRLVARYGDACNVSEVKHTPEGLRSVGGAETVRRKLDRLRAHCEAENRPDDEVLRTHFTLRLVIAPTEATLAEKLDGQARRASSSPGTRRAHPSAFVTGTPEAVAAHYRALVAVGIQYFIVQLDMMDQETIELLATQVMPFVG